MVRRTYKCGDCGNVFKVTQDAREALLADCPTCTAAAAHDPVAEFEEGEARIQKMADERRAPGVRSNVSRAVDLAHNMMETDYGMTDANDTGRQGDAAFKAPAPIQSREAQAITRQMVEAKAITEAEAEPFVEQTKGFWQHQQGAMPANVAAQVMQAGAAGAAEARSAGVDPIALMHQAGKQGLLKDKLSVVASSPA